LFECLMAGVPVLASDFPPVREIVCNDPLGALGEVVDPLDPAAVADGLRRLLDMDPDAAAELRARCLDAARARWNWEAPARVLGGLYQGLLGPEGEAQATQQ